MKTDVTKIMVDEHCLILRMITLLEKNTALMEQGRFRNWTFFIDAIDFIRNYADRFHHAKEEAVLFVELVKNGMPEKQSPIEAMLMEHDQGRAYLRAMEAAVIKAQNGETGMIPVMAANASGYAELLRNHIDKEDRILYPLAERVLPENIRTDMLRAYAATCNPETEAKYLRLVLHYEQQV